MSDFSLTQSLIRIFLAGCDKFNNIELFWIFVETRLENLRALKTFILKRYPYKETDQIVDSSYIVYTMRDSKIPKSG